MRAIAVVDRPEARAAFVVEYDDCDEFDRKVDPLRAVTPCDAVWSFVPLRDGISDGEALSRVLNEYESKAVSSGDA